MRPHHTVRTSRLEAFSDGVIAVIITIMVLELRVPTAPDGRFLDGFEAVRAFLPSVLVYLLSFVQVGIYWVNHHYLLDQIKQAGHRLLWCNLIFLFSLSLIPFATVWVHNNNLSSFSISLYAATCLLPAASYTVLAWEVRGLSQSTPSTSLSKMIVSLALYLSAIFVASYRPWIALTCIATVAVLWLIPPRTDEQDTSPKHPHLDAR